MELYKGALNSTLLSSDSNQFATSDGQLSGSSLPQSVTFSFSPPLHLCGDSSYTWVASSSRVIARVTRSGDRRENTVKTEAGSGALYINLEFQEELAPSTLPHSKRHVALQDSNNIQAHPQGTAHSGQNSGRKELVGYTSIAIFLLCLVACLPAAICPKKTKKQTEVTVAPHRGSHVSLPHYLTVREDDPGTKPLANGRPYLGVLPKVPELPPPPPVREVSKASIQTTSAGHSGLPEIPTSVSTSSETPMVVVYNSVHTGSMDPAKEEVHIDFPARDADREGDRSFAQGVMYNNVPNVQDVKAEEVHDNVAENALDTVSSGSQIYNNLVNVKDSAVDTAPLYFNLKNVEHRLSQALYLNVPDVPTTAEQRRTVSTPPKMQMGGVTFADSSLSTPDVPASSDVESVDGQEIYFNLPSPEHENMHIEHGQSDLSDVANKESTTTNPGNALIYNNLPAFNYALPVVSTEDVQPVYYNLANAQLTASQEIYFNVADMATVAAANRRTASTPAKMQRQNLPDSINLLGKERPQAPLSNTSSLQFELPAYEQGIISVEERVWLEILRYVGDSGMALVCKQFQKLMNVLVVEAERTLIEKLFSPGNAIRGPLCLLYDHIRPLFAPDFSDINQATARHLSTLLLSMHDTITQVTATSGNVDDLLPFVIPGSKWVHFETVALVAYAQRIVSVLTNNYNHSCEAMWGMLLQRQQRMSTTDMSLAERKRHSLSLLGSVRFLSGILPAAELLPYKQSITSINCACLCVTSELGQFSCLQTLILRGLKCKNLPPEITNLHTLTTLDISGTKLEYLPMDMGKLQSLQTLRLTHCAFKEFPSQVADVKGLKVLDLKGNRLVNLPELIGKLLNLTDLFLSKNNFTVFPSILSSLPLLSTLDLSHNALQDLPSNINFNFSLTNLNLSNNVIETIAPEIGQLQVCVCACVRACVCMCLCVGA